MNPSLLIAAVLSLTCAAPSFSQETKNSPTTQAELEAAFTTTLTNATFSGRWTGIKEGALTAEKDEQYHIVNVTKDEGTGDNWTINARMKYGKQEIVIPILVKVKWAGDTAVIIVDNLTIPGGGTYNARVLVFENTYAGTWSGGQRGGLLSGIITNEK